MLSMSEFDILLIAVKQILQSRGEAQDRIQLLREELAQAENTLRKSAKMASALEESLRDTAIRAGLISSDDQTKAGDLESLDSLVRERILIRESAPLPDNVVELPRRSFFTQRPPIAVTAPSEEAASIQQAVKQVLDGITKREANVIRAIIGMNNEGGPSLTGLRTFTQSYVAEQLGLSQQAVSSTYRKAMRKLRHPARSGSLRPFLEKIDADNITFREELLVLTVFET